MHSAAGLNGWLPKLARDQLQFVFMPLMNHTRVHCERVVLTHIQVPLRDQSQDIQIIFVSN